MQPLNSCELVLNVTYSLALKSNPSYPEWMPWLRSGCPVGQLSRALVGSPKGARGVGLRKPRSLLLPLVINFSEALCPLPYTPIHLNDLSDCTKTASHKKMLSIVDRCCLKHAQDADTYQRLLPHGAVMGTFDYCSVSSDWTTIVCSEAVLWYD